MMQKLIHFGLFLCVFACQKTTDENKSTATMPTQTLVFFDKSQSVSVDDKFVYNKFLNALKQALDKNIKNAGDEVVVYFVHENTEKAKTLSMVSQTKIDSDDGLSQTDLEAKKTEFEMAQNAEKQQMLQALITQMESKNEQQSNSETDLLSIAKVVATSSGSDKETHVYIFSDMIESQSDGRDFHKSKPKSEKEATDWADTDAKNPSISLQNTDVTMILPFEPNSSSVINDPNITVYWKRFFENIGAKTVREL